MCNFMCTSALLTYHLLIIGASIVVCVDTSSSDSSGNGSAFSINNPVNGSAFFPINNSENGSAFQINNSVNRNALSSSSSVNGSAFPTNNSVNGSAFPTHNSENGSAFQINNSVNRHALSSSSSVNGSVFPSSNSETGSGSAGSGSAPGSRGDYERLVAALLARSNPRVPANADDLSRPVNVNVTFSLRFLQNLDTETQIVSGFLDLTLQWFDPSLQWNVREFPINQVYLRPDTLWRPEVIVGNSMGPVDSAVTQDLDVKVAPTGSVTWRISQVYDLTCTLSIKMFPFDEQDCAVALKTWMRTSREIQFAVSDMILPIFPHPEWDVNDIYVVPLETPEFVSLVFRLRLKRKWLFYALNVLMPIALVSLMNCVVFVLPVQCGEKMSVSVTTFLALAVFMTLIQESLPKNSDTVSYLAIFVGSQAAMSVLSVLFCTLIVNCHHRNDADDGDAGVRDAGAESRREAGSKDHLQDFGAATAGGSKPCIVLSLPEGAGEDPYGAREKPVDWPGRASRINLLCFFVFVVVTVLAYVIFFALILTGSDD